MPLSTFQEESVVGKVGVGTCQISRRTDCTDFGLPKNELMKTISQMNFSVRYQKQL